ncbi:MerR family transcriptional regulator [Nocardioides sp. GY 10113]|uniref:MerR family transcriptional regulator n=1 Tax=Nocardioides sp. GY 10113 TaxID=2569761 RepID=UPI0010A93176|nr:MerR family transcriptional regulator [Nocardioides sp. GY 10113]TIC88959.1 MerR family transcriptional regulator [Nocardioides sp. GY 10113]
MSSDRSTTPTIRWTIGELAARFDLPTNVLRHWEGQGLLSPDRDPAGRRYYVEDDAYRVAVILSSKAAGMSLDQIAGLVDGSSEGRHRLLTEHLADLDRRQEEIERSRHLTRHALECSSHDVATCPGFQSYVADIVSGATTGFPIRDHRHHTPGDGIPAD